MRIPIYQIDAFAREQFKGNPAAVCPLEWWIEDDKMQQIAAENNLSETAFFVKKGNGDYDLRWFTPKSEIDLCGHATLASAYVIFQYLDQSVTNVKFHTLSGILEVSAEDSLLSMVFPAREGRRCETPAGLAKGLGKEPKETYLARDYLAVFETEDEIRAMKPDFDELKKLEAFGVIATARGNDVDFVSRFFAPKAGIDEDPVTGSSHCTLIPYWKKTLGKDRLEALQLSERGGRLICCDQGDTVKISGEAVTYLVGTIEI